MSACRAEIGVYESLLDNLGEDGKISDEFLAEFKRQTTVGLPIPDRPSPGLPIPDRPSSKSKIHWFV